MSNKFVVNKENVKKLALFADYLKKMEAVSPLEDKHVFLIDGQKSKLKIFGVGNASQVESEIDLTSVTLDGTSETNFVMSITGLLNSILKITTDEVQLEQDGISIVATPSVKGKKESYKSAILGSKSDDEIKELTSFIGSKIKDEFKSPIKIDISKYGDALTTLAALTKTIDYNQQIMVEKGKIKFADNLAILKVEAKGISAQDIYIHRDLTSLFKGVDEFQLSDDQKFCYFDIKNHGIKIIFSPKTAKWQFPSDEDIIGVAPEDSHRIVLELNSAKFFDMLDKYNGMFDAGTWIYHQIKVRLPAGWDTEKVINTEYDNMATEVKVDFDIENIVENTDSGEDFEFILPTIHVEKLKELFMAYPTFKMTFNSIPLTDEHGLVVYFENADINLAIVKIDK